MDPLTGLQSRAAWLTATPPGFSLLLVNLDGFKRFNAHNGHAAGDELLRQVADHVRRFVTAQQPAYRISGDGIAIVLPGIRKQEAVNLADRLRESIEAGVRVEQPAHCGDKHCMGPAPPPTVSIGVASGSPPDSLQDVLYRAEAGLWDARCGGRNRVVAFPPEALDRLYINTFWVELPEQVGLPPLGLELVDRLRQAGFDTLLEIDFKAEQDVARDLDRCDAMVILADRYWTSSTARANEVTVATRVKRPFPVFVYPVDATIEDSWLVRVPRSYLLDKDTAVAAATIVRVLRS